MNLVVDNQIVRHLFLQSEFLKDSIIYDLDNRVGFHWAHLLEYLELGSILSTLPPFDANQPLFTACVSTLYATEEKEVLYYVYDRLFAETLNQIKALAQIDDAYLLQAIREQREKLPFLERLLGSTLSAHESALKEPESKAMHDLILYLAWDRMCVRMGSLFNFQSSDPKFIQGISVLKECLIESYLHIAPQGQTAPSFYRLIEALLFYQMRDENLQKHTAAEWTLLSQSFPVLKEPDELPDYFYIDNPIFLKAKSECYATLDSPERVHRRLALAQYMIDKLKKESPEWGYTLRPIEILYLKS